MNVQYVSDLHNESKYWVPPIARPDTVLVIAGDIHTRHQAGEYMKSVAPLYSHVVACLGNHDFWGSDLYNAVRRVKESVIDFDNVHVLNRETITLNGVEFVGCTLWTDVPPNAQAVVTSTMRDFEQIRVANGQVRLYMDAILQEHKKDLSFLTDVLSTPSEIPRVVITHHAPSSQSIDVRYKQCGDAALLNHAYHTNLDNWAQDKIFDLWVHGHTHNSFDYAFGPGVLRCNPRGYWPGINPDFKENEVVDMSVIRAQRKTSCLNYESWWNSI